MELSSTTRPPKLGTVPSGDFENVRKDLEAELQTAIRDENIASDELVELRSTSKALDESLQQLEDRLAGVTQELAHAKLNYRVQEDEEELVNEDPALEMVSYRDYSKFLTTAFENAARKKLRDKSFTDQLDDQKLGSRAEFCRVLWESESADWKVHDPRDNTEVTFGALLEDVSRYWGLDHESMAICDGAGAVWPLNLLVYEELSVVSKDGLVVHLCRLPNRKLLNDFDVAYEIDEASLPLAIRRKLNRERRQAEANKQTRESIRREKQRERAALCGELVKCVAPAPLPPNLQLATAILSPRASQSVLFLCPMGDRSPCPTPTVPTPPSVPRTLSLHGRSLADDLCCVLCRYVLMMALYFVVLYWRRDVRKGFLLLDSLNEAFVGEEFGDCNEKGYMDIANYEEFFSWARGPFIEGLLPESNYDDSPIPPEERRATVYNRVVGGIRVRQARVTPNAGCNIALNVQEEFTPSNGPDAGERRKRSYVKQCYSNYFAGVTWSRRPYSVMAQDPGPDQGPEQCRDKHGVAFDDATADDYDSYEICLGRARWPMGSLFDVEANMTYEEAGTNVTDPLLLAFTWRDEKANELEGFNRRLKYSTYDGSGFVFELNNVTTENFLDALQYLEDNSWLDRQTRAIFLTIVVYNANFNQYASLNFELELSLAGVLIPRYNLQTAKLDLYWGMLDDMESTLFVVIESLLYFGMFGYLLNEFREVSAIYSATGSVKGYFQDVWNVVDWGLIILSFISFAMRLMFIMQPAVRNFDPFSDTYQEITAAVTLYNDSFSLDAIAASFGIIKIFRYFDLQDNLLVLRRSIARGVTDLATFTVMLLTMMMGFAFAFMNIFGQESNNYIDIERSFTTLFLMVLGEFEYDELYQIQPAFALAFFLFYQFFVFLIMVNIFLAILNDAYLAIKEKFEEDKKLEPPGPPPLSMKQRIEKMRNWFRQRELSRRIEVLRSQERQRDLKEKREARKISDARAKTMKAIGLASAITDEARNDRSKGRAPAGEAAPPPVRAAAREDPQSALLRHEQL